MTETCCQRDDEAHVSGGKLMQRILIALILPPHCEVMLLRPFQERRRHRRLHELSTNAIHLRHGSPSLLARPGLQMKEQRRCKAATAALWRVPTPLNERLRGRVPHRGRTTHAGTRSWTLV